MQKRINQNMNSSKKKNEIELESFTQEMAQRQ